MKKIILGAILSFFVFGAANAEAMPKYEPHCLFSGCGGVSTDGKRAIFTFDEPLDMLYPGSSPDMVYERSGGRTKALFEFPEGKRRHVRLYGVSDDARVAVIQTRSPLSDDDQDGFGDDYYAIENGKPRLLSWDPADPATKSSSRLNMQYERISDDGRTVYFIRWNPGPGRPWCLETWARTANAFTQLPLDCTEERIQGIARDGSLFTANEYQTVPEGMPAFFTWWANGIDRFRDGQRSRVVDMTDRPGWHELPSGPTEFADASEDGEAILFGSHFPFSEQDTDEAFDLYLRDRDGRYEFLIGDIPEPAEVKESDKAHGLSSDGSRALITTEKRLSPADTDSSLDAYVVSPGQDPVLVTTGPADDGSELRNPAFGDEAVGWPVLAWRIDASDDLTAVAFDTKQRLVPEDRDNSVDVYLWRDGETELVSTGPTAAGAELDAKLFSISNDGSQVAFSTREALVAVDTDNRMDIYSRTTGHIGQLEGEESDDGMEKASVSSSAGKKPKRRTRLISAESIAPRMKVVGKVSVSGRRATVRLHCPKAEKSGPCRGKVQVRVPGRKVARGSAGFRVKSGKTARVKVRLSRKVAARKGRATLRIKAADRLGNTARSTRKVSFR